MSFKNQKGFSLAEVMMAAGMLGVIALGVNKLVFNQNKSMKTVEKKFEVTSLVSTIRTLLSDREACHNTFGITAGPPPTGTYNPNNIPVGTITELRNKNNDVIFESNVDPALAPAVGNGKIKILSFDLNSTDVAPIVANSTGITNLTINFYRGKNIYGAETISKVIQLNTRTDASLNMIDCGTTAVNDVVVNTTSLCEAIGGVYDPAGRAGVGDCHSLQPNNETTFNGNIIANGTSALNGDTTVNGVTSLIGNVTITGNLTVDDTFSIEMLSDKRLKYDVTPLSSNLDKIEQISPVEFKWKKNSQKEIGFIAQNIESIYPELVSKTKKGLLAVKYSNFVAVAIGGIKEQQTQIEKLEAELMLVRETNDSLHKELGLIKRILCSESKAKAFCQ